MGTIGPKKDKILGVPLTVELNEKFKIVADIEGVSMASLARKHIKQLVREAEAKFPHAFKQFPNQT